MDCLYTLFAGRYSDVYAGICADINSRNSTLTLINDRTQEYEDKSSYEI